MPYEYPPIIAAADYPDPRLAVHVDHTNNGTVARRAHNRRHFVALDDLECRIRALSVRSQTTGRALAQSFADGPDHAPVATDGAERFCFAPGVETLELAWHVGSAPAITELTFSLHRPGADEAASLLWRQRMRYVGRCPSRGHLVFNGNLAAPCAVVPGDGNRAPAEVLHENRAPAADFPDGYLTIDQGPYKLKVEITQHLHGTRLGTTMRWVYLDVLLANIALEWGDERVRPNPRADVGDPFEWTPRTPGAAAVSVALRARVRALEAQVFHELAHQPPSAEQDIVLPSDLHAMCTHYQTQFIDDEAFRRYRDLWGNGPRLPLWARLTMRRSDGVAVDAPLALGAARFVWDWEEKPGDKLDEWLAPGATAATREFVAAALAYKVESDAAAGFQPAGATNCHADHGGKRGANAPPVFPPMVPEVYNADSAELIQGLFPFPVEAYPERRWAALSQARRTGVLAGCTGAIFQPSRMAGDTFRVTVHLKTRDFPHDRTGPSLREVVHAPWASTGHYTIHRSLRARYFRLGNARTVNRERVSAIYLDGGVRLNISAPEDLPPADYQAAINAMLAEPRTAEDNHVRNFAVRNPQPVAQSEAVFLRPWADYAAELARLRAGPMMRLVLAGGRAFAGDRLVGGGVDAEVIHAAGPVATVYLAAGAIHAGAALERVGNPPLALTVNAANVLDEAARAAVVVEIGENQHQYDERVPDVVAFRAAKRACRRYIDQLDPNAEGMFFFQFKREFAGQRMTQPVRALAPSDSCEPHRAIFVIFTDYNRWRGSNARTAFPGRPRESSLRAWKALDPVVAHELGHNLCINHASTKGDDTFHEETPALAAPIDNKDHCLMNYHPNSERFCGKCVLRLRGWAALANDVTRAPAGGHTTVVLSSIAANNRVP